MRSSRGGGARSWPTRPAPRPSCRPPPTPPPRDRRPAARRPSRATTAPHDRLTEWWYYTGHLRAADGRRFGFEFVDLPRRARRLPGDVGVAPRPDRRDRRRASPTHQRTEIGPQVDRSPRDATAADRLRPARSRASTRRGADGRRRRLDDGRRRRHATSCARGVAGDERRRATPAAFGLDLALAATQAAGAPRHGRLDRLRPGRRLVLLLADRDGRDGHGHARRRDARGRRATAWFDHQWGDFISVGGGGWDWFAVNLDDGTDLTLSLVRDADGSYPLVYGTLVDARRHDATTSTADAFTVEVDRPLDQPGDRRRLPGRLADPTPGRGARHRPGADRRRRRSWTRGRRPASSTGRDRRSCRRPVTGCRSAARPTWS